MRGCLFYFGKWVNRLIAIVLVCAMLLSYALSAKSGGYALETEDFNETILTENILYEDIFDEVTVYEDIVYEEKLYQEIVEEDIFIEEFWTEDEVFENVFVESLLSEDMISEVYSCNFTVIEQDQNNFIEDSLIYSVYGTGFDYNQVLEKFFVGGGIILVTAIVKVVGEASPYATYLALPLKRAIEFSTKGAALGSLTGGLSAIDARLGLAVSLAELIYDVIKLTVSSMNPITLILGVASVAMSASRVVTAIDTFRSSDVSEINWNNIDWEEVGYSALDSGASGFEFGAAVGALAGSVEAAVRLNKAIDNTYIDKDGLRVYKNIPKANGKWSGEPGDSDWIPDKDYIPPMNPQNPHGNPYNLSMGDILRKYNIEKISYKDGYPDFTKVAKHTVNIKRFTADRKSNFAQADEALAMILGDEPSNIARWRKSGGYVWHEVEDIKTLQLVPQEIHSNVSHSGGVSIINQLAKELD